MKETASIHLLALCFTLALIPFPIVSFSVQGNLIRDLEKNDTSFAVEAAAWDLNNDPSTTPVYTQCEDTYLMGGYNIFAGGAGFKRIYENLPSHDVIYYSLFVSLIDGWTNNTVFIAVFNGRPVVGFFSGDPSVTFERDYCGDPNIKDAQGIIFSGKLLLFHTSTKLTLQLGGPFEGSASTEHAYFGFREIILHLRNKTSEDVNEGCANANLPNLLGSSQCPCQEGQHKPAGSSTCQLCHPACETCLGPLASQCLKCKDGAFFDGVECTVCHPSCNTCFGGKEDQCLTCPALFYLFEGNRCIDKCDAPLIKATGSSLICLFPCGPTQFLTSNGGCQDNCRFGYNSIELYGKKFCNDYCPSGLNFVPPISTKPGSCLVDCPSGTTKDTTVSYCHHCQDSLCVDCPINNGAVCTRCQSEALLNRNGICTKCDRMEISYLNPVDRGHQYKLQLFPSSCNPDPQVVQQFLSLTQASQVLIPNTFFEAISSSPNLYLVSLILQKSNLEEIQVNITLNDLNGRITVPKKLVPSEEMRAVGELAPVAQTILIGVVGVSFAGAITLGSTATIWSMISFQQFVGYFIYINIDLPFQLEIFMSILGSSAWGFLPNPLESITASLKRDMLADQDGDSDEYMPPQRFVKNDVTSFFIENGGSIIVINLAMHLILVLLKFLKKRRSHEHSWLKSARKNLRWNILARAFLENGIPLFLAVCLQMRVLDVQNAYIGISSVLAFIALVYFIAMLVFLVKYLHSRTIKELKTKENQQLLGTLNEGIELDNNKPKSKYYHMLIFARGIVLALLIVFLQALPVAQIIPLILMNAILVVYLFKEANFEDHYLGMVNKTKESLILIGEMFILGLVFKNGTESFYDTLGWLAVACFSSAFLIETIYMIVVQIKNFKETKRKVIEMWNTVCKWLKEMKSGRKRSRKVRLVLQEEHQNESTLEMIQPGTEITRLTG